MGERIGDKVPAALDRADGARARARAGGGGVEREAEAVEEAAGPAFMIVQCPAPSPLPQLLPHSLPHLPPPAPQTTPPPLCETECK